MLYSYELRKLFSSKLIPILLILLLLADAVTCAVLSKPEKTDTDETIPQDSAKARLAQRAESCYLADPEGTLSYYLAMDEMMWDYQIENLKYQSQMKPTRPGEEVADPGDPPVEPIFPHTYTDEVDDYVLLHSYFSQMGDAIQYEKQLRNVISSITRSLEYQESFEGYENTYAYREQRVMLSTYLDLLANYTPTLSIAKGWEEVFSYRESGIFLMLAMLIVGCQIVLSDYTGQMTPILRSTKRGRLPTALAKLGVGLTAALPIAVVFTLAECVAVAGTVGLSTPFAAIQNLESYLYCPYPITIFTAVLIQIALRTVAGMAFVAAMLLLARLTRKHLVAYGAGLLLFATNLLLHFFKTYNDFFSLNCFTLASGVTQMEKAAYANVMNMPCSMLTLTVAVLAATVLLVGLLYLIFATLHRGQPGRMVRRPKWLSVPKLALVSRKNRPNAPRATKSAKLHRYPLSIFYFEGYKHLRLKTILLVAVIALIQIVYIHQTYKADLTPNEKLWESYQEQFAGELTDERKQEIDDLVRYYELLRDNTTKIEVDATGTAENDLENGVLYFPSMEAYVAEINLAYLREPVITRLDQHTDYLEQKANETGVRGWLLKDTGLLRKLEQPMNVGLYLILLILLSELFGYEGKFTPVLRISKNGRSAVWRGKLAFAALISLVAATLFAAVDWICYFAYFDLPALSAPLYSLASYQAVTSTITVGQYLIFVTVLRIVAPFLLGLLVAGLSGCLHSARITLLASGAITLLPLALYFCGIDFMRYLDFTKLLSGNALWLLSWEIGGIGLLIAFVTVAAALAAALIVASYRKFCK